ncbi:ATP-dependent DNA ligase [Streptomyces misionensis]|uniref:ATP-dependent DNA ligase n=1 Tax=Streptomyces misionensis TaxID=67331 RepID=UPI0033A4D587
MTHRGCATPEPSCRTPPRWTGSWWCGRPGRLAFERLQEQAKRRGAGAVRLAEARPAHFVAFDLLRLAGTSTMSWPYTGRREALEHLFSEHRLTAPWRLCPSTTDPGTVREWVTWTQAGVEGVLFKTGWTFPAGWSIRESLHVTLVRRPDWSWRSVWPSPGTVPDAGGTLPGGAGPAPTSLPQTSRTSRRSAAHGSAARCPGCGHSYGSSRTVDSPSRSTEAGETGRS